MNLDHPSVSRVIFHPRPEDQGCSPQGTPTRTKCGTDVVCGYLHQNPASDILVLFFHGNGEIAADYDLTSSYYTDCGVSFWVVDYRGYGRSTGDPLYSSMLSEAEALLSDVPRLEKQLGRSFKHIFVMGRSLGSTSAIHLAANRPDLLRGLLLDSPYADAPLIIRRLGGPSIARDDMPGFEDNIDKMRRCTLPVLIIHGENDSIIPITESEALYQVAPSKKQFRRIPGAGHNNLMLMAAEDYFRNLKDFIAHVVDSPSSV